MKQETQLDIIVQEMCTCAHTCVPRHPLAITFACFNYCPRHMTQQPVVTQYTQK